MNRTHDAQNRLLTFGSDTLTYDGNGIMTTDERGNTFQYDAWNRVTKFDGATYYRYDALGRGNRVMYCQLNGIIRNLYYSAGCPATSSGCSATPMAMALSPPTTSSNFD